MVEHLSSQEEVRTRLVPVLLGADLLIYSYIRSFHETYGLEHKAIVLTTKDVKIVSSSKFCDYRAIDGVDNDDVLMDELLKIGAELKEQGLVGIVLGSGDWYARTLSKNKDRLQEFYFVPYNDFELLDYLTQKDEFQALCDQHDLRHPITLELDCSAEAPRWDYDMHGIEFPCIAKPSNSAAWHFAEFEGKRKIHEPQSMDELRQLYDTLRDHTSFDRKLLVQDMIPGGDDSILNLNAYIDASGKATYKVLGQVVLQDHAPTGLGNPVCVIDAFRSPQLRDRQEAMRDMMDKAISMVAAKGYRGWANFDVKYDVRNGSFNLFEINTRPGRCSYYISLSGMPFVKPIIEDFVLGNQMPEPPEVQEFCLACIPSVVVRNYVTDEALRDYVLNAYAKGWAIDPVLYERDGFVHGFWAKATTTNQIRKFDRYLGSAS